MKLWMERCVNTRDSKGDGASRCVLTLATLSNNSHKPRAIRFTAPVPLGGGDVLMVGVVLIVGVEVEGWLA
jgi:hypothetical protein